MKLNLDSRFTRTGLWLTGGCALLAVVVAYLVTAAYGYGFSYFLIVALLLLALCRTPLFVVDIERAGSGDSLKQNVTTAVGGILSLIILIAVTPIVVKIVCAIVMAVFVLALVLFACWILTIIGPFLVAGMIGAEIGEWLSHRRD